MISCQDIINFIKSNKGKVLKFGNGFLIQVYEGETIQANISYNQNVPFIKMEQREDKSLSFFLEKTDETGVIDYSRGCKLGEDDPVISLFREFYDHPQIEKALIALLELH